MTSTLTAEAINDIIAPLATKLNEWGERTDLKLNELGEKMKSTLSELDTLGNVRTLQHPDMEKVELVIASDAPDANLSNLAAQKLLVPQYPDESRSDRSFRFFKSHDC